MKTLKTLLLVAVVSALTMTNANAQVTETATASATIVQDLELEKQQDMNFGVVIPSSVASTVVLLPIDGTVAIGTGTGQILSTGSSAIPTTAAQFKVTGSGLTIYTITLPSAATTLSNGNGDTMTVDTFTTDSVVGVGITLGSVITQIDVEETFSVGGTLNVGANQNPGLYTGTFDVEVNYL